METAISLNSLAKPKLANQKSLIQRKISVFGVCMLGLGRLIGVRCQYWNQGFAIDLAYLYMYAALTSVLMIILACSLAEMTGSLPFTGGTYGFARGIYGPYLGFLVGILEILTSLACMAAFIHGFGEACVLALRLSDNYIVVFFALMIIFTAGIQSLDAHRFSWVSRIFTGIAVIFLIIYFFSPLASTNHAEYPSHVHSSRTGSHGWRDILGYSPTCWFFFTGIEMLPIIAHDSRDPRHSIPIGLLVMTCLSIVATFATYAVSTSQSPGIVELQQAFLPLSYGFANIFHISVETAMILNIPFQLASLMVSQYFLCIIIRSMAESGLLPSIFLHNLSWPKYNLKFPYFSASLTLTLSTVAAILAWVMDGFSGTLSMSFVYFFSFPYYTLYIALFVTYIIFRKHFSSLPRTFVSPFGVVGAYVGIAITSFFLIATCFYAYNWVAFSVYCLIIGALSWVYRVYVHRHETFSGEEERVFFPTYVIRSNQNQQKRIRKNSHFKNQQTFRNLHSPANHSSNNKENSDNSHSNIASNHHRNDSWQSSNSWSEEISVPRTELPRRFKPMFKGQNPTLTTPTLTASSTVTPTATNSSNDITESTSASYNSYNSISLSMRMNKVVPLIQQTYQHQTQSQSSSTNEKSVIRATSSGVSLSLSSGISTRITHDTKGRTMTTTDNIRASSIRPNSAPFASQGFVIPPRINTNADALIHLESADHEDPRKDENDGADDHHHHRAPSSDSSDRIRLQKELTFEEALASSEDDTKLRYIRQHLHQHRPIHTIAELDLTLNGQENKNSNNPSQSNLPARMMTNASHFFTSFLFPSNTVVVSRSRSSSQSNSHSDRGNNSSPSNLHLLGMQPSRATSGLPSPDVQTDTNGLEMNPPPMAQRSRPSIIELMLPFKWKFESAPTICNNEATIDAAGNFLTEQNVIFQIKSDNDNEVNKHSGDQDYNGPYESIVANKSTSANNNDTSATSGDCCNELTIEDIPEYI
jgi:amino acid transporter